MVDEFRELGDAREILELVIRRSMHWLRSTMRLHNFAVGVKREGGMRDAEDCGGPANLFFDVDPRFEEQNETLKEYQRWDMAFQPLLKRARGPGGQDMFMLASTLRLHWLAGYMSIASNNCSVGLRNGGRYTKELEELISISRMLLEQPTTLHQGEREGTGFVFDMQIIVPLMTVGWVYRHRALRREAIQLLLRSPRKEGVWDGIVVGRIMEWLAGIEEEGIRENEQDQEYVPEKAAARCIKMHFETEKRESHVSCLQPVKGSLIGEEVKRKVVIPW